MKKWIASAVLAGVCLGATSKGITGSNPFTYDREQLQSEFTEVAHIENYLMTNDEGQSWELSILMAQNQGIVEYNLSSTIGSLVSEPPLGIPSFIWGFCLGLVGMLIVNLVTEDKEETKKALLGCLVGTVVGILAYFLFLASLCGGTCSSG